MLSVCFGCDGSEPSGRVHCCVFRALTTEELAKRGKLARERHAERMRQAEGEVAGKKTGCSGKCSSHTLLLNLMIFFSKCCFTGDTISMTHHGSCIL